MIIDRMPQDDFGVTWIYIYPDGEHKQSRTRHEVYCAEFDYDEKAGARVPPTVHVHLLGTGYTLCFEDVKRLAREYDYVADVAVALEAEKRAAYEARFAEG